jgi:hypothetical protein
MKVIVLLLLSNNVLNNFFINLQLYFFHFIYGNVDNIIFVFFLLCSIDI